MDAARLKRFVDRIWDEECVPELVEYVKLPAKSPAFDPDWAVNGFMEAAVQQYAAWARKTIAAAPGATLEILRIEGRTPVIFIDIPGAIADETVLFYGHLDKQPEATGWGEGKGPWSPVVEKDRLYGRGSADDGYAMFGALSAIMAVRDQGLPHARCVVLIEACEESGSYDLPPYLALLGPRLGSPSLVVCLDSGCGNYEQLWLTTSLRGMTGGVLTVKVLEEAVHSGDASGVVASSFRILRSLLSRLEDEATGEIIPDELKVEIPAERIEQAKVAAAALGDAVWNKFPFVPGMVPMAEDAAELLLNKTWRPTLSVTGLDGAPPPGGAGNALRVMTAAKLSIRLPPTLDAAKAGPFVKALLERDPPYGAEVEFAVDKAGNGWNAPELPGWLTRAVDEGSKAAFGKGVAMVGEGGSIPLMGLLSETFPQAQFVITGVLGPQSNAHGPNEFLDIPMVKGVTVAVAQVLADHARANSLRQAA